MIIDGLYEQDMLLLWAHKEFVDGNRVKASKIKRVRDRLMLRQKKWEEESKQRFIDRYY